MKILIACEESQTICKTFRKLGFDAFSCDILECSGGKPEWHIIGDALKEAYSGKYTAMIAHPPCTYLTVTGNKWMKPEFRDRFPDRPKQREDAINFFMSLYNAPIKYVAVENPVGIMSTVFRKPDQYVHPYHFGDPYSKKTGLWLKGLPKLKHTNVVKPGESVKFKSGKSMAKWYLDAAKLPPHERSKVRSKTFQGLADQIAKQWGDFIKSNP